MLGLAERGDENLIAIRGYSIVKILGKGGFGEVYLAQHNQTGNCVALKVMLPTVAANDRVVQMFMRETENTKALRHEKSVEHNRQEYICKVLSEFPSILANEVGYVPNGQLPDYRYMIAVVEKVGAIAAHIQEKLTYVF